MSWHEASSGRYAEWPADTTGDIPFYVALARAADGPVVELAVGTGRVAIPVALATGRPVTGPDATPAMPRHARTHAAEAGVALTRIEREPLTDDSTEYVFVAQR